jgi:DNA-binding CsgD family transcriptional regulator
MPDPPAAPSVLEGRRAEAGRPHGSPDALSINPPPSSPSSASTSVGGPANADETPKPRLKARAKRPTATLAFRDQQAALRAQAAAARDGMSAIEPKPGPTADREAGGGFSILSTAPPPAEVAAEPADPAVLLVQQHERRYLAESVRELTDRERDVLFEICAGGKNEDIAKRLGVALPTLRTHLMRLNRKLGTESKSDLVRFVAARLLHGYRCGFVRPAGRAAGGAAEASGAGSGPSARPAAGAVTGPRPPGDERRFAGDPFGLRAKRSAC